MAKLDQITIEEVHSIANGIAEAFINSSLQRRYEASAYARDFLQKQIAKTRADLEQSERQLVGYAQAQGIINTGTGECRHAPRWPARGRAG